MRHGPTPIYRLGVELNSQAVRRGLVIVDRVHGGWKVWLTNDEGWSRGSWIILSDEGVITKVTDEHEIELWRDE